MPLKFGRLSDIMTPGHVRSATYGSALSFDISEIKQ